MFVVCNCSVIKNCVNCSELLDSVVVKYGFPIEPFLLGILTVVKRYQNTHHFWYSCG